MNINRQPACCWVELGSWGLGIKWYKQDRTIAIQLGKRQFEAQLRSWK